MGTTIGSRFAPDPPLVPVSQGRCGYLAGQARAGRGRGLQAPAGALWSLGPHPTCLGSPRESQGHSPRQSGPAHTGVGRSRLPGCGGRAESAGLRGGRAAAKGTDCGAAMDPHIFPLASSDSAPPAPVALAGPLTSGEACGVWGAGCLARPGPPPALRGRSRDAGGRVLGTLGTQAEVAERGPQARGQTDRAPGSGAQSPPGPRRWVSDAQPRASC